MKHPLQTALVLFLFTAPVWSQTATNLALFGTNNPAPFVSSFEVDGGFTTAPFSQDDTTLTLVTPFAGTENLFGVFGSLASPATFDWSSEAELALSVSAATAPTALLFVDFFASDLFTVLANAQLDLGSITAVPSSVSFDFQNGTSIGDLTNVSALFFTWGGASGDASDVTIGAIQAVPEPSTWAMLIFAGVLIGGVVWRRRRLATVR